MVLRIKNFNIFWVHWKIQLLRGGGRFTKNQYRSGGLPEKGGRLRQFVDLRGAWQERGGSVFEEEGSWYPNAHYVEQHQEKETS